MGGQRSDAACSRFKQHSVATKAGYVVIAIGMNDVWQHLGFQHETVASQPEVWPSPAKNVTTMVDAAQKAGVEVMPA